MIRKAWFKMRLWALGCFIALLERQWDNED